MNWPKVFRAGWADYRIRAFVGSEGTEKKRFGEFAPADLELRYEQIMPERRQAHTLIHEALHALIESTFPAGFWEAVQKQETEDQAEEMVVSALTDALSVGLRDNVRFWRMVTDCMLEDLREQETPSGASEEGSGAL